MIESRLDLEGRTYSGILASSLLNAQGMQILTLISGALIARALGVEERGILAAVTLWPALLFAVGNMGGPIAYTYFSATDEIGVDKLVEHILPISIIQTLIIYLVGLPIVVFSLWSSAPDYIGQGVGLLLLVIPMMLVVGYFNGINRGVGRFRTFNLVRISVPFVYAALLLMMFITGSASVTWAIVANVVSWVIGVSLVLQNGDLGDLAIQVPKDSVIRKIFDYGFRGHLGNLAPLETLRIDMVLAVFVLSPHDLGLYTVATAASMVIRAQGNALGLVVFPQVARKSGIDQVRTIGNAFRLMSLINIGLTLVVVLLASELIRVIYGSAFVEAANATRLLAVGMVMASGRRLLSDCLRGADRPGRTTITETVCGALAVIFVMCLAPGHGIVGIAIGVSAAHGIAFGLNIVFIRKLGVTMKDLFYWRPSDVRASVELVISTLAILMRPLSIRRG